MWYAGFRASPRGPRWWAGPWYVGPRVTLGKLEDSAKLRPCPALVDLLLVPQDLLASLGTHLKVWTGE